MCTASGRLTMPSQADFQSDAEVALSSDSGITSPPLPRPAPATRSESNNCRLTSACITRVDRYVRSEVSFQIQRDPKFPEGIGDASGAITLAANSTSFRDLTVEPNTRYQYRVRSVNESVRRAGENYSEWVSVATPLPPPPPTPPPTQPAELTRLLGNCERRFPLVGSGHWRRFVYAAAPRPRTNSICRPRLLSP